MTNPEKTLGLYLHVPFCVQKCRYCDFHSAAATAATKEAYVAALAAHLREKSAYGADFLVESVYFGGGTPTVLSAAQLTLLLDTVRDCYHLAPDAEITVECNPVTGGEEMLAALRAAGFNRLSIGLQSANDCELSLLGRAHDFAAFRETFAAARRVGFDNISVDVMFGIPSQTMDTLTSTLDAVIALSPEHISAYGLRIEEGTPFYLQQETLLLPDEDTVVDMQLLIAARLRAAGYLHYEVSNYAKAGKESRHNTRYWKCLSYLGFGAAAHSYFGGERYAAPRDTALYVDAIEKREFDRIELDKYKVCGKEAQDEYVMLKMRLFEGIDEAEFYTRFGISFADAYGDTARLESGGFLERRGGRIAFTEEGMYVSNAILSDWLDFGK